MKTASCTLSSILFVSLRLATVASERVFTHQFARLFGKMVGIILIPTLVVSMGRVAEAKVEVAELQFAICENDPTHVIDALSGKTTAHEERDVYWLETRGRDFERFGAVMRYRLNEKGVKSAAKVSFVTDADMPRRQFEKFDAVCEVDGYLSRAKIGCAVKDNDQRVGTMGKDQIAFFKKAGVESALIERAQIWGPVRDIEWTIQSGEVEFSLGTYYVAPGKIEMELSTRVSLVNALGAQQRLLNIIHGAGLRLCEEQIGVTKKVLDHFISPDHDPR